VPELTEAAAALLRKIDDITTDDFQRGGERAEPEALRAPLARIMGYLKGYPLHGEG